VAVVSPGILIRSLSPTRLSHDCSASQSGSSAGPSRPQLLDMRCSEGRHISSRHLIVPPMGHRFGHNSSSQPAQSGYWSFSRGPEPFEGSGMGSGRHCVDLSCRPPSVHQPQSHKHSPPDQQIVPPRQLAPPASADIAGRACSSVAPVCSCHASATTDSQSASSQGGPSSAGMSSGQVVRLPLPSCVHARGGLAPLSPLAPLGEFIACLECVCPVLLVVSVVWDGGSVT
jgi:hypothetical protein